MTDQESAVVAEQLREPFQPDEVEWKAQSVSGNRCLAVAYIDARAVMDRLDRVLGLGNWQASYRELTDGVVCRLKARVGGEWFEHEDVGGFSDQPDKGDKLKSAFSDALKRAAVHLGVGRYLYSLPVQWVDYDPQKKRIVGVPKLPPEALPKSRPASSQAPSQARQQHQAEKPTDSPFLARLRDKDAELATLGLAKAGELLAHVRAAGEEVGAPADLNEWGKDRFEFARQAVAHFEDGAIAATRARPAGPEPINQWQIGHLARKLAQKNVTLADVSKSAGFKKTRQIESLSVGEWALVLEAVAMIPMPVKEGAA